MQIIEPVTHNKNKDDQPHNEQLMMMKRSGNREMAPMDRCYSYPRVSGYNIHIKHS
jgi:hypothetical protein